MGIEAALASVSARTALHYPGEGRRTTARDFSVDTQRFELTNGLIVLLAPDRGFSNVLVWTPFRAGTLREPAGRSGLAHLVEHLMATGPTAQTDYQTLLETRGARHFNASTDFETMQFETVVPAAELQRVDPGARDRDGSPARRGRAGEDRECDRGGRAQIGAYDPRPRQYTLGGFGRSIGGGASRTGERARPA